MTVELLSALVLCASVVVTLVASLQQARHERRRADALAERWAAQPGEAVLASVMSKEMGLPATRAAREARCAPHAAGVATLDRLVGEPRGPSSRRPQ